MTWKRTFENNDLIIYSNEKADVLYIRRMMNFKWKATYHGRDLVKSSNKNIVVNVAEKWMKEHPVINTCPNCGEKMYQESFEVGMSEDGERYIFVWICPRCDEV